jgi:molybdenum cofactor cytidylyltransferase
VAVVGLVPAAGRGSRFVAARPGAPPKVLTLVDGEPMVRRTAMSLIEGGVERCVVVVSPDGEAEVRSVLSGLPVTVVVNPDPDRGMFSSIQCAAATLGAEDRSVLLPADMPFVRPETVALVLSVAIRTGLTVAASHAGRRGHPLVFSSTLRDRILQAAPDAILSEQRDREECLSVEVPDPGVHRGVDRPGDLIIGG